MIDPVGRQRPAVRQASFPQLGSKLEDLASLDLIEVLLAEPGNKVFSDSAAGRREVRRTPADFVLFEPTRCELLELGCPTV